MDKNIQNNLKPLDYSNSEDVAKFQLFLVKNIPSEIGITPSFEDAKKILEIYANIDDKPDQLALIDGKLYGHVCPETMNNPQKETPDSFELEFGTGPDVVCDMISRTLDLALDLPESYKIGISQFRKFEYFLSELNKYLSVNHTNIDPVELLININEKKDAEKVPELFTSEFINSMKPFRTDKDPLNAAKNIVVGWKEKHPERIQYLNVFFKENGCINEKGFTTFLNNLVNKEINKNKNIENTTYDRSR